MRPHPGHIHRVFGRKLPTGRGRNVNRQDGPHSNPIFRVPRFRVGKIYEGTSNMQLATIAKLMLGNH